MKECPFCGNEDETANVFTNINGFKQHQCRECGAMGPMVNRHLTPEEAWDNRESVQIGGIEKLVEEFKERWKQEAERMSERYLGCVNGPMAFDEAIQKLQQLIARSR